MVFGGVIVFFTVERGLLGIEIGLKEGLNLGGVEPGLGEAGFGPENNCLFSKRDINLKIIIENLTFFTLYHLFSFYYIFPKKKKGGHRGPPFEVQEED